jgi:hypothetical protein
MQKYIGIILLLFFGAGVHAQNNIKSWEYWFNSDYASVVNEDVAGIHTLEVNEMIDVSTLGDGLHTLSFRFKDARGVWGPPQTRFFIKYPWTGASATQLISEYEYRVDNSNGDAVGGDETTGYTHVALETPVSPAEIALTIDLREHPKGEYYIHFRAKDTRGLWGSLVTKSMTKEAFPVAAFSPSTATHCVNSAVQFVNESIDADTWLWDFGDGTTSTDFEPEHVFSGAGDFEVSLTATDSESGRENTITQTLTINPTYSSQLPSAENVIAYYPFNGNANDESGNEHHGAVNGATLAPDRFGKSDGAYVFDGVDDYIDLGDWENGGAMSFAFWARWDAFNWYSRIIDLGNGSSSDNIVICNHQDNNNLFFSIFLGSSDTKFSASGITLNQWDFYTATVDGSGVMTLYKNGIQIGQYNGVTPNYMLRTKQYIGKSNFTSNDDEYFEGAIDEITIYDIALAPEEVQEVFEKSQNSIPPVNMEICESETPFIFGGQELSESGTYTEAFQTVHGCDSVVTVNLQVNPVYDVMYSGDDAIPDYLVNETFEEIPLNTFPDDWVIRYAGTGADDHFVVDDPVKNGVHALKVSGSGWAANLSKPVENIPDNVVLEGWMRAEDVASSDRNGLGIGNPDVGSWGAYWGRVEFYNGNLITFNYTGNAGGYGTQYVLQPASPNTWYHVKIEADAAAGTYKVYIDGQQASSATGGSTTTEFPLLTSISATSAELYGNGMIYFDDIRMYEGGAHPVVICESETPYIFGDQELTESGTYTETFQTIHGCDSVVTLNLVVNPTYNHTDAQTICEGETYVFGTQNLTTPGEYTEVFESVDGCDSTVVLTLTVNPGYNHTDEQTICEGETYVFGTQNLTTSGEYTEVFESVDGCDSTVVLTLTVNPGYNHTDEQTICEGETYVFGTQNLTTPGEYTEVFESVDGCDSTVVLTLTVNPGYNHTDEQTICEGKTYVFGTQNLTTPGEYTEVFESVNGCDSTVVLTLTVNPGYNHTETATICEGETYVFGTQNLTTSGEYTEVFESVDGCDSTVVLTLTVNPGYNHTETATICEGETYVFGTQNLTTSGEYTEVFESVNGCDSVVTLTLTVNPMYEETVEVTIHEDELPYIFGGENLNEGGVYTKTFTSVAGCDSIVTLTLKVLEYSVPVAVCNPITIYLNETGNYSLSSVDLKNIAAGSSDAHTAFADLILSVTPDAFTCADAGNDVDVMVIVTNEDNYSDTCYTSVSVEDNIAPKVDCHDLEVYLGEKGEAFIDVNKIYSDAYDACGIKNIKTSREVFTCDDLGYNYFSVSVTDFNQNKTSCLNILAVFDTIRPVFGTVDDIEVAAPEGECKTTIDYPEIPAGDNCGVENLFLYEGLGPDGEFPVGTTTERWVAVDASGNSDTLTFEVKISDTPSAPGLDAIPDVEVEEDADWVTVTVTGISDGSECEEYPLGFIFSAENDQLIESYLTEYVTGEEMAYLKLLPSPDATGESNATLTVTNSETGQETGIDFILRITPVNDPPYLVHPVQDLEMKAGDSLEVVFNPEKGIIFDDVDEDDILQLSVRPEDGTTLPEWLVFRNDSLLAFPAAADTGCVELLLVATDLTGEEVNSPFMLCVDFSVGTNLFAEQGIKIYPNPTTGKVYIELSGLADRRADVSVVNILGQKVLHKIYQSEGHWEIDLSNQVSGIYLLKIRGNGIGFNRKIVLNREE